MRHTSHIFQMMEDRPTGYREAKMPDDVLGKYDVENVGINANYVEQYETKITMAVRYSVPHPDALRDCERTARQQLHALIFRDYYELATQCRRALYDLSKVSNGYETKEMHRLSNLLDELAGLLSPSNCP